MDQNPDSFEQYNILDFSNQLILKLKNISDIDSFKIIFFCIILFNFTDKKIVIILLICFVLYYFLRENYIEGVQNIKKSKNLLEDINIFKYKYLVLDVKIVDIYQNLLCFKKYNINSYNKSLTNMNNFLKIYYKYRQKIKKNELDKSMYYKITNAIIFQRESLNSLMSMIINIPINIKFDSIPGDKFLENKIKELFILTNQKLLEMSQKYNFKFENDININSKFINLEDPFPNPVNSYGYMENYDLY
jgi:hypothetical protein